MVNAVGTNITEKNIKTEFAEQKNAHLGIQKIANFTAKLFCL